MKEEEENKKRNFSSCVFPAVSFLKSFFGGGLEKMSRMEFDGVEKTIWWTSKSQKKRKRAAYVLRGGERNKEILAEKSRDVNARVSIEKENN
jgi:hypothetical protein